MRKRIVERVPLTVENGVYHYAINGGVCATILHPPKGCYSINGTLPHLKWCAKLRVEAWFRRRRRFFAKVAEATRNLYGYIQRVRSTSQGQRLLYFGLGDTTPQGSVRNSGASAYWGFQSRLREEWSKLTPVVVATSLYGAVDRFRRRDLCLMCGLHSSDQTCPQYFIRELNSLFNYLEDLLIDAGCNGINIEWVLRFISACRPLVNRNAQKVGEVRAERLATLSSRLLTLNPVTGALLAGIRMSDSLLYVMTGLRNPLHVRKEALTEIFGLVVGGDPQQIVWGLVQVASAHLARGRGKEAIVTLCGSSSAFVWRVVRIVASFSGFIDPFQFAPVAHAAFETLSHPSYPCSDTWSFAVDEYKIPVPNEK